MLKTLMIVDGNSLINRAYYALPNLTNGRGVYTGAVYGFLNMFFKVTDEYAPTHAAVAFDRKAPTFRHQQFDAYKAGRKPMPPELAEQLPLLQGVLEAMQVPVLMLDGYEADDILGTMAQRAAKQGMRALIVTGDRDALQLIGEHADVLMMRTRAGAAESILYNTQRLKEELDLNPGQIIDLKALMGDSSDNIPGVAGVGEKTALKLLHEYHTVEAVLDNAAQIKRPKLQQTLLESREVAMLSKELATIFCEVPVDLQPADAPLQPLAGSQVASLFTELGFRKLLSRVQGEVLEAAQEQPAEEIGEQLVKDEDELEHLAKTLMGKRIAILLEDDALLLCTDEKAQWRIPLRKTLLDDGLGLDVAMVALKSVLEDGATPKVLHDGKRWMGRCREYGITLEGLAFDTMLAGYLLDATAPDYSPERLIPQYVGQVQGAASLWQLATVLEQQLTEQDMHRLYFDLELPLVSILYKMEREGFTVDADTLKSLGESFELRIRQLETEIFEQSGRPFNILSPKQLGEVLFEELKLPAFKKTKTGYSTDIDVLEQLDHPIARLVVEYRQLTKLKSTYVDGLTAVIAPEDGRVHTVFNQTVAATGRLSSVEPNLQNIPVRTAVGREIRKVFHARSKDFVLVDADYSQIELRVLAHCSGDERLIDAFLKGQDIHRRTAAEIDGVPMEQVSDEMRSHAKAVNFGIVYGISDFGLAKNTGLTRKQASEFIKRYFATYPGVKRYMEQAVESAKEQGFAQTLLGRRRPMPELKSSNHNVRSFGERVAMNMPIQGTAADIIKLAMVRVANALDQGGFAARLILQVHDELIFDVPKNEVEQVLPLVKKMMEEAFVLSVPLVADVGTGESWYDAK